MLVGDWLQGSYLYALYKSYGYSLDYIALFFVIGFSSSAVFGTIAGSMTDTKGRKLGSLAFCIIYGASCFTKLDGSFWMIVCGRVLGGISTSLLHSVFESWMVSAHYSNGFPESSLYQTFAWSTFLNGFVAIISGIVANLLVDHMGLIYPFLFAGVLMIIAGILIQSTWTENYGNMEKENKAESTLAIIQSIVSDYSILSVGIMQCTFESGMYVFVFLWSPVMEHVSGSTIFKTLRSFQLSFQVILSICFTVSTLSFIIPILYPYEWVTYLSFNLFECCCGIYFPSIGSLRSNVIPEKTRSTIMNVFRIPLNMIVVGVLLKVDALSDHMRFGLCALLMVSGGLAAFTSIKAPTVSKDKPTAMKVKGNKKKLD
ncbi:hypothetical protein BC833DRAFT_623099 [Globomyces pollinis-pini]|nr:hypothetical protein BC833DRAFT_623099 [Globomyces pollinis-pini]